MSCDTLNSSTNSFQVSMASLPEGFCPANMQELANAIAARLIISPNQSTGSFVQGSVEPSSNVGPWLRNCLEWFVFDDATASYIPIRRGFDSLSYFNTAGAGVFVVPDSTYKLKIHVWGGGGGGSSTTAGATGSGGGGGGYGLSIVDVTPGQSVPYTIGAGGAIGTDGGATSILTGSAGGGKGSSSAVLSGDGGATTGFNVNLSGQGGMANSGSSTGEGGCNGGDAGGWGGKGGAVATTLLSRPGTSPGGGGSGGGNTNGSAGGIGAAGAILFEY